MSRLHLRTVIAVIRTQMRVHRVVLSLLALSLFSGCYGYIIDILPEMHYQQPYRAQEPPRVLPPEGGVPVTGRERAIDFASAKAVPNPLPNTAENSSKGQALFAVNCAPCHGAEGRGDGMVAKYFAPPPPAMQSDRVRARTDGEIYWILGNGLGNMPSFGKLLTPEERWELVLYIRSLQAAG